MPIFFEVVALSLSLNISMLLPSVHCLLFCDDDDEGETTFFVRAAAGGRELFCFWNIYIGNFYGSNGGKVRREKSKWRGYTIVWCHSIVPFGRLLRLKTKFRDVPRASFTFLRVPRRFRGTKVVRSMYTCTIAKGRGQKGFGIKCHLLAHFFCFSVTMALRTLLGSS